MYCRHCKREISEQDELCPHCGMNPHESSVINKVIGLVLKVFACICALGFLFGVIMDILYILLCLSSGIFLFFFGSVTFLLIAPFAFCIVAGLLMIYTLYLIAFCRTAENTPYLTYGLVRSGVAMIVVRVVLKWLVMEDRFLSDIRNYLSLPHVQSILICIVGVYFLLFMMKEAPKFKTLFSDSSSKRSEFYTIVESSIIKLFKKRGRNKVDTTSIDDYELKDSRRPVRTDRVTLEYIIYNFITCGIYGWFYTFSLANDVNVMCKDDGKKTGSLLRFIILNILTYGIYSLVWWHRLAARLSSNAPRYGLKFQEKGGTIFIFTVVGIFTCGIGFLFIMDIIIKNTNSLAAAYNQSETT